MRAVATRRFRSRATFVTVMLMIVTLFDGSVLAASAAEPAPGAARVNTPAPPPPLLKASRHEVEEGARLALTATIKERRRAVRVTLQRWDVPPYYGTPSWENAKTVKVRNRRKITFHRTVVEQDVARYRVLVQYKGRKRPVASRPRAVRVWRWIPLREYSPYYDTGGTAFGTVAINGRAYSGWRVSSFSHAGAWESRFTPGRRCKGFRAVLGVADFSDDGSSARIAFTADERDLYTSPALRPGMGHSVRLNLPSPYRFGIRMADTSPGGTSGSDEVESWPGLGDPAFLCSGV